MKISHYSNSKGVGEILTTLEIASKANRNIFEGLSYGKQEHVEDRHQWRTEGLLIGGSVSEYIYRQATKSPRIANKRRSKPEFLPTASADIFGNNRGCEPTSVTLARP